MTEYLKLGESSDLADKVADVFARKGAVGRGIGAFLDIAFILICGWLLARLFWAFMSPAAFVDVPVANSSRSSASGAQSSSFSANPIVFRNFNPFARTLDGGVEIVEEEAPATTLNLSIRSVFATNEQESSFVRIHTPDNEVRRYYIGDTIVSGVSLDDIQSDRVILLRNGVRETLFMNERSSIGTTEASTPARQSPQSQPGEYTVSGSEWSFETFYRNVTIRRVAQPDQSTVLQIQGTTDAEMLARVGMRVNDKLIRVNGYDMADESLSDLYDVLSDEDRFAFEIERNGQVVPITVVISQGDGN